MGTPCVRVKIKMGKKIGTRDHNVKICHCRVKFFDQEVEFFVLLSEGYIFVSLNNHCLTDENCGK